MLDKREIKIGFTGTQIGMNQFQKNSLNYLLDYLVNNLYKILEYHHGDCIGADFDFNQICKTKVSTYDRNQEIVIHPPINSYKRAFCNNDGFFKYKTLPEKQYLDRNQDIVDSCDILIATPKENIEQLRSGTWSTIRRAKKAKKHVIIIYPNKVETWDPNK